MTPEEQEELDRLLAAGARYGAPSMHVDDVDLLSGSLASSQDAMAPPLPPMEDPRQAPPPPEALAPIPPAAAPQGPAQPPPQGFELPPPIPLPERGDPHAGGTRGGRIVHGILGALGQAATGRNMYTERLARERAMADDQYARQVDAYNRANAQRGQQVKEGRLMAPIGEEVAEQFGIDPNTPRWRVQDMVQTGMFSKLRDESRAATEREQFLSDREYDQQIEEARRNQDFERERELLAMKLAAQRKRGRPKGGGGTGAPADDGQADVLDQGERDVIAGSYDTDAARAYMASAEASPDRSRRVNAAFKAGGEKRQEIERARANFVDYYTDNADVISGLRGWEEFKSKHEGELDSLVRELSNTKLSPAARSDAAKNMINAMRKPIAAFLRKMAGAAMSPSEAGLHGGAVAQLLVGESGSWASTSGIADRLEGWLTASGARPEDVLDLISRVSDEADEKFDVLARTAPIQSLTAVPRGKRVQILKERVRRANPDIPDGAVVKGMRIEGRHIIVDYEGPGGTGSVRVEG